MPRDGLWWWHLILHTRGSWLHGDPRGFRSRDHRIHSGGDYKNPPPKGEHARLHKFHRQHDRPAVLLPRDWFAAVGQAARGKCEKLDAPVLAISVGPTHLHALAQWIDDVDEAGDLAGRLKQRTSHALRHVLPGRVWAEGGKPIRIRDQAHQRSVYQYILNHALDGDWVWSFREEAG